MTGIYSAGFEDYSKVAVDIDKKDEKYNAKTYESLLGIRMPDGIALYSTGGTDYVITANEGDSENGAITSTKTSAISKTERLLRPEKLLRKTAI